MFLPFFEDVGWVLFQGRGLTTIYLLFPLVGSAVFDNIATSRWYTYVIVRTSPCAVFFGNGWQKVFCHSFYAFSVVSLLWQWVIRRRRKVRFRVEFGVICGLSTNCSVCCAFLRFQMNCVPLWRSVNIRNSSSTSLRWFSFDWWFLITRFRRCFLLHLFMSAYCLGRVLCHLNKTVPLR